MRTARRSAYRRTRRAAVLAGTALLAAAGLTAGSVQPGAAAPGRPLQAAPFSPGTGTAIAIAYKVNPVFGNLSFGITAGESIAAHQNTGANAQSKAVNLGVIGVTLAGEGCKGAKPSLPAENQPQPVIVGSDDPGAAQGERADLASAITMMARATKQPLSEAITTVAPLGDPSVALITGGRSQAISGVVAPGVREARAISEIGEIRLLNGLVVIQGLRWEAIQRTGAETVNTGTFSMGALVVGGQATPIPADSKEQLRLLKDLLEAVGLAVTPPATRFAEGIVFVDPLTIGIVPSTLRDGLLGNVLNALRPVREVVVSTLFELGCKGSTNIFGNNSGTAVTVLDLALATVSGAGYLTLELGGVSATTKEISGFEGLGVNPLLPDLPGSSIDLPTDIDLPGSVPPAIPTEPTDTDTDTGEQAAAPTRPISESDDGTRGGALLAIGLGGLLLLLATAEGDRRKMRRAQREIFLED